MNLLVRSAVVLGMAAAAVAGTNPAPAGLGASTDAAGNVTFRVYSSRATRLEVWIYADPLGETEKLALPMDDDPSSHIWSRSVCADALRKAGIAGVVFYGYRAWGPNWPYVPSWKKGTPDGFLADVDDQGNRFNPNKLLLDPYALEMSHDPRNPSMRDGTVYLSGAAHRAVDTGAVAPKGVVFPPDMTDVGTRPQRSLKDELIYEVHIRGLTGNDPTLPEAERGTYAGAARKAAELKDLGVTAVEFLPVFELQNDQNGLVPGSAADDNYWGYDPISFFAPDRRYATDKTWGGRLANSSKWSAPSTTPTSRSSSMSSTTIPARRTWTSRRGPSGRS